MSRVLQPRPLARPTRALALGLCLATACTGNIGADGAGPSTPGEPGLPDTPGSGGRGGDTTPRPPDGTPPSEPPRASCPEGIAVGTGKWRRLTKLQYRNTIRDLLGFEADTSQFLHDTRTGPFDTNAELPAQEADIDRYRDVAEALGTKAAAEVARIAKCDPKTAGEDVCATRLIADLGTRAYRRALTVEETTALTKVYQLGKQESFATGIRMVVEAVLQSPSFLYLAELGGTATNGVAKLTGYEVASRLSYLLWNSMPDADLFAAAKDGGLDTVDGIRKQADRLLASERFLDTAAAWASQLFHVSRLAEDGEVSKGTGYPEFDATLRQAMQDEARAFVRHVFTKAGGTVEALLTTPAVFPTGPLVKLYGLGTPAADGRLDVTNGQRAGILTLAGALTAEPALATPYAAVHRGRLVRVNLLCQDIPPPTVMVEFKAPPGADRMSEQELLRVHQENPTCSPCHKLMDSIGFGLSQYDAIGRFRTTGKDGKPIIVTGEIVGMDDGAFDGPKALAAKLAKAPEVRTCMARQWFRFALGREIAGGDACSVRPLEQALAAGAGDLRQVVSLLVASDAFRYRRVN